tara:strand:+ start:619 stop:756 length:138 start_codon:yes stop_codon:yes gene_type:complete
MTSAFILAVTLAILLALKRLVIAMGRLISLLLKLVLTTKIGLTFT